MDERGDTDVAPTAQIDASRILEELTAPGGFPEEAILVASSNRAVMVPAFLRVIERYLEGDTTLPTLRATFFIFHMLGAWREKSAYRLLAKLLRQPNVDLLLDVERTESVHRVMAAVFDGDPQPLYDLVLDSKLDQLIRTRMCKALVMATLHGELPRAEAARFLRACYSYLQPKDADYHVWAAWLDAIALLGLVELKPVVQQALESRYLKLRRFSFEDFEEELERAIEDPASCWCYQDYDEPDFTMGELSGYRYFSPESLNREKDHPVGRYMPWLNTVPPVYSD